MNYYTRKIVTHKDLNLNETLFGGRLLEWIDEAASIYCLSTLNTKLPKRLVTKSMSKVEFHSTSARGDIIEIGIETTKLGYSSIYIKCEVRNLHTKKLITSVDEIVFVNINEKGKPSPHGVRK